MNETQLITGALMLAGVLGCFLPILPGPPLVWLGALFYGWRTDFVDVTPLFLAFLLIPTLLGSTADLWMGFLGAKKGGASFGGQLAALGGGLAGLLIFSLPGLLIGSLAALAFVEFRRARDWSLVVKAGSGYLVGYLLSMAVEFFCVLVILGAFLFKAAPFGQSTN